MAAVKDPMVASALGTRAWNFGPGPAMLPHEVLLEIQDELPDYRGSRQSVMELPHRGSIFRELAAEIEADLRALMDIPSDYAALFLPGGATLQYAMVPLNLAGGRRVNHVITGHWGERALGEARRTADVQVAADSKPQGHAGIPPFQDWKVDSEAAYLHYTVNETINGVEFHGEPDLPAMPLVGDMTSMILSRPVDVRRHALIYASAQKNLGISGITIVIVRQDALCDLPAGLPAMLDYRMHIQERSMFNTPPTFPWYVAGKMLKWTRRNGGVEAFAERNRRKAEMLYACVDRTGFYVNKVERTSRSFMNVPFNLAERALEPVFLEEADSAGLVNLAGHRVSGGVRASIYNAMPLEGVQALVTFMEEFERRHG